MARRHSRMARTLLEVRQNMMYLRSSRRWGQLLAGAVLAFCTTVHAQEWPTKPVKIIVPYAPGGVTDMLTRLVANKLSVSMKQSFIVENQPGASGIIGSDRVAKAPADGYTLLASGMASLVIAPSAGATPFDPMKSFSHVALLGGPPLALVVHPSLPAKDVKEFIAYANAEPDGLSYGSPGSGTHNHLMGELFRTRTNTKLTHISYKGGGPATADLLGGHIKAAFLTFSTVAEQVKTGKLRLLAVTSSRRLAEHEGVPTFAELGYGYLTTNNWCGISAPAGTPPAVLNKLNAEIQKAMRSAEVREVMKSEFIEPNSLDAAGFTEYFGKEIARWAPVIKAANLKLGG
ncbi:MAG: tripartite tricarboxylate transporter substrate binding protein [Ramlibacter sp.]|nr:tripartite tricarboxylate transporter substrate binding protein [Ramlibacter sp.]MDB5913186.1 tripartite tricarboxylate transporter substrate binding protein [Ramlibacter sp.]